MEQVDQVRSYMLQSLCLPRDGSVHLNDPHGDQAAHANGRLWKSSLVLAGSPRQQKPQRVGSPAQSGVQSPMHVGPQAPAHVRSQSPGRNPEHRSSQKTSKAERPASPPRGNGQKVEMQVLEDAEDMLEATAATAALEQTQERTTATSHTRTTTRSRGAASGTSRSPHGKTPLARREQEFQLPRPLPMAPYISLQDANLQRFLRRSHVRHMLQEAGLMDAEGNVLDVERGKGRLAVIDQEFYLFDKSEDRAHQSDSFERHALALRRDREVKHQARIKRCVQRSRAPAAELTTSTRRLVGPRSCHTAPELIADRMLPPPRPITRTRSHNVLDTMQRLSSGPKLPPIVTHILSEPSTQ